LSGVALATGVVAPAGGSRLGVECGLILATSFSATVGGRRTDGRVVVELTDTPDETRCLSRSRTFCAWLAAREDVPTVRTDTVDTVDPVDTLRERAPDVDPPEPPDPVDVGVRISDCAVRKVDVSLAVDKVEDGREVPGIFSVDSPGWL